MQHDAQVALPIHVHSEGQGHGPKFKFPVGKHGWSASAGQSTLLPSWSIVAKRRLELKTANTLTASQTVIMAG